MEAVKDIVYVGVNDHEVDLFEGQYVVPNGMAYNSYVIMDEKIAVMDTVDANFGEEWMNNLKGAMQGRTPDYLIVQHMEPDHSANEEFLRHRLSGSSDCCGRGRYTFTRCSYINVRDRSDGTLAGGDRNLR